MAPIIPRFLGLHATAMRSSAASQVLSWRWGPPLATNATGTCYQHITRASAAGEVTFAVGDVAMFVSEPPNLPFVGLIERMWETPEAEPMLNARWFYRPKEIPSEVALPATTRPNELFFSEQRDVNSVSSLLDKCVIEFEKVGLVFGELPAGGVPPKAKALCTYFVCNSELVVSKRRIQQLNPRAIVALKTRSKRFGLAPYPPPSGGSGAMPSPSISPSFGDVDDVPDLSGGDTALDPSLAALASDQTAAAASSPSTASGLPSLSELQAAVTSSADQAAGPATSSPRATDAASGDVDAFQVASTALALSTSDVARASASSTPSGGPVPVAATGSGVSASPKLQARSMQAKSSLAGAPAVDAAGTCPRSSRVGAAYQATIPALAPSARNLNPSCLGPGCSPDDALAVASQHNADVAASEDASMKRCLSWSSQDVLAFCAGFNRLGKRFRDIALGMGNKTTNEVAQFYYVNKYRKDRKHLRDSQVMQLLLGGPDDEAASVRARLLLTSNQGTSWTERLPGPQASVPTIQAAAAVVTASEAAGDVDVGSERFEAAPAPPVTAFQAGETPVTSTEEVVACEGASATGTGSSAGAVSVALLAEPQATPASVTLPAAAAVAAGGGTRFAKRSRKSELPWCTTCRVARQCVLPCMWDRCGVTVCPTCYSQQSYLYRARAVGETWKGACLNPFWVCSSCSTQGSVRSTKGGAGAGAARASAAADSGAPAAPGFVVLPSGKVQKQGAAASAQSSGSVSLAASGSASGDPHAAGASGPGAQAQAAPGDAPKRSRKRKQPATSESDYLNQAAEHIAVEAEALPYIRDSQAFLDSVRTAYVHAPSVFRSLTRLLQYYYDSIITEHTLAGQVLTLLKPTPALSNNFLLFLSPDSQKLGAANLCASATCH